MQFVFDDGGRADSGRKGFAGDCVARSIAIAAELPYDEVYRALAKGRGEQRATKRTGKKRASAREGINTKRKWFRDYMASIGFEWVPTMQIGSGCTVHLRDGELPGGRLIVAVSNHYTAVIDGVVRDTHDPQRCIIEVGRKDGVDYRREIHRCVYGYWRQNDPR